jgi:hypothetical protein
MQSHYSAIGALVVLLAVTLQPVAAQYGATYLGCFSFSRLLYLKGMEGAKVFTYCCSCCYIIDMFEDNYT